MRRWFWGMLLLVGLMTFWAERAASAQVTTTPAPFPQYREIRRFHRDWYYVRLMNDMDEYFAFSPPGTQFAAVVSDTQVDVWDIATGRVLHAFPQEQPSLSSISSVSWSPDGTAITTADNQGTIRVWEAEYGVLRYELPIFTGTRVAWSPDSAQFATSGVNIFDAQSGALVRVLGTDARSALWSPDGSLIASITGPGEFNFGILDLWSVDGSLLDTYWSEFSASWSPDSTRIASFGEVRDVRTGLLVTYLPGMQSMIAWHPGGQWIASADGTGHVFLWDAITGEGGMVWEDENCYTTGFAWSPDGERFAVSCTLATAQPASALIIMEQVR